MNQVRKHFYVLVSKLEIASGGTKVYRCTNRKWVRGKGKGKVVPVLN
jgi:hypothetical protein